MLLQRGSVGDDLWQRFLRAEKEMEDEVRDVVAEVSSFILLLFVSGERSWMDGVDRSIGKCIRAELGPNNIPIRERDDE